MGDLELDKLLDAYLWMEFQFVPSSICETYVQFYLKRGNSRND